jgi:hypothetical protein
MLDPARPHFDYVKLFYGYGRKGHFCSNVTKNTTKKYTKMKEIEKKFTKSPLGM